jgi:hypothetical protein
LYNTADLVKASRVVSEWRNVLHSKSPAMAGVMQLRNAVSYCALATPVPTASGTSAIDGSDSPT